MRLLLLLGAFLLLATPAAAWRRGSGACPYGSAYADGCPGAPANANFRRVDFLTYATQNGQASQLANHPMGWNLPGVDYAVGYSQNTPLVAANASPSLPSGCTYQTSGGGINATSKRIFCNGSASPTISGIDFTNGDTDCVTLEFSSVSGTVTISGNKFAASDGCLGVSGGTNYGWLVKLISGSPSVLAISSNYIDGEPSYCTLCTTYPLLAAIIDGDIAAHTTTIQYNAFVNNSGRVHNGNGNPNDLLMQFNYIEGLCMHCDISGLHGEISQGQQQANASVNYLTISYNTVLMPKTTPVDLAPNKPVNTVAFHLSTGSNNGQTFASVAVDHTVVITNANSAALGTPVSVTSVAGWELAYNNFTAATYTDDYIDPNGAEFCTAKASAPTGGGATSPTFTRVYDLYDGSLLTGYDVAACPGHGATP